MKDDTNKVNALVNSIYKQRTSFDSLIYHNARELAIHLNWDNGIIKADLVLCDFYFRDAGKRRFYAHEAYQLSVQHHLVSLKYHALYNVVRADMDIEKPAWVEKNIKECLAYFKSTGDIESMINSGNLEISLCENLKKPEMELAFFNDFLKRSQTEHDNPATQAALHLLWVYYAVADQYPKAIHYKLKQLSFYNAGDTALIHRQVLEQIAISYYQSGNYAKALDCFEKLRLLQSKVNLTFTLTPVSTSMANIYETLKDYRSAIKCREESLTFFENTDDYIGAISAVSGIGRDYQYLKLYDKAHSYINYALKLCDELHLSSYKTRLLPDLVWLNYLEKDYADAIKNAAIQFKLDDDPLISASYKKTDFNLGSIYRDAPDTTLRAAGIDPAKRYQLSLQKLNAGLQWSKDRDFASIQDESHFCFELSQTYNLMKDYKNAYQYYTRYTLLKDSVAGAQQQTEFRQKESQYAFAKEKDSLNVRQLLTDTKLHVKQIQTYYLYGGIAVLVMLSFFIALNYNKQRLANMEVSAEKQRSDALLLNILPADVAEELKEKGSANARLFDEVTVLFTDFVNFTTISELLSPQQLVDELHTCFKAFDDIMAVHHIEKIKTIGDAYLAVAGLPNADAEHAANAVAAALEIRQFISDRKNLLGDKTFDIRIGIHSGSVVAGIVGVKKFAYDIWGDTVNTAARMEQNSEPGKINVSEKTYELVKDQFAFTYRGEIEAKNKGALKMYFAETNS